MPKATKTTDTTSRTENGARQLCRGALEQGQDTHFCTTYTTLHLVNPLRRFHFCDQHPLVREG